jgi:hypothetical protein
MAAGGKPAAQRLPVRVPHYLLWRMTPLAVVVGLQAGRPGMHQLHLLPEGWIAKLQIIGRL